MWQITDQGASGLVSADGLRPRGPSEAPRLSGDPEQEFFAEGMDLSPYLEALELAGLPA